MLKWLAVWMRDRYFKRALCEKDWAKKERLYAKYVAWADMARDL